MRIGRLKVIFKIPNQGNNASIFNLPSTPLAYVEWYSMLTESAHADHLMYQLTCLKKRMDDTIPGCIVPLSHIRQSCHLIPKFSSELTSTEKSWNAVNVLDKASTFYLNNWCTSYSYQTLW